VPGVDKKLLKVAVIGNPNCGKSSIFNLLTGLQQKVGNFPGVTVERKSGKLQLPGLTEIELTDFPGAYSLYPNAADEKTVVQTLCNPSDENYPDAILYIADVTRLEKHLLLLTQIRDLGFPVVLVLNMMDLAQEEGTEVDVEKLTRKLGIAVCPMSGRSGEGVEQLKQQLAEILREAGQGSVSGQVSYRLSAEEGRLANDMQEWFPQFGPYQRILLAHHRSWLPFLSLSQRNQIEETVNRNGFKEISLQVRETLQRYHAFTPLVGQSLRQTREKPARLTEQLDNLLTHQVAGPLIFFGLMLLLFQAIFAWASYPMDLIEGGFGALGTWLRSWLPAGYFADLVCDGLLAGLSGILVFVPQIAILFFLIAILEEVGYMARAAFMFDRIMQVFGLNGRSVVALISGGACAIPAIMSTRTISNWKERLITILVTPFISCSARIPVFTVLIAFAVPQRTVWGFFQLQGLAFMGLYLLGIAAALISALLFKWILRSGDNSFLMLELPPYRTPVMRNIWVTVWEKVKTFSTEAGKIILLISLVLWVLSTFGPPGAMDAAARESEKIATAKGMAIADAAALQASMQMEASFAGQAGHLIEPLIRPLGFDWKIGIALITSFAAREVFVGTMATLYSIGSDGDTVLIRERMARERDPISGEKVYTPATSWALLLFYVFAMQCMSTMAVVRRETLSWKWPLIQFVFMTALAYLSAWGVTFLF
jgi:ferrous iron transport protein B